MGTYIATVKGKRFEFDLGRTSDPTGKTVMYSFTTHWDGKVIPSIKISHEIPNLELNSAAIINKNNDIDLLQKEIDLLTQDLNGNSEGTRLGKIKEKEKQELSIGQLKSEIDQKKKELTDLEQQSEKAHLSAMLQSEIEKKQNDIVAKQNDIIAKQSKNKTLLEEIETAKIEKKANQEKLDSEKKLKRNLAIVIHQEHETAQQLRNFASLVLGENKGALIKESADIVATCENYIKMYDENIDKLKKAAETELGFWS